MATPTSSAPWHGTITADLTDVTSSATYTEPSPKNNGYFFKVPDGEKFFTDVLIFAGHVISVSYEAPAAFPTCGPGKSHLYVFELGNAAGFFPTGSPSAADRTMHIGAGIPSSPRATIATDPTKDKVFITTSTGQIIAIDPPLRDKPESGTVYWKQNF